MKLCECKRCANSCFNPTMVRLLPKYHPITLKRLKGFNPTMVRLLLCRRSTSSRSNTSVSIPQWCDCCERPPTPHEPVCRCFNPTMVRLLRQKLPFADVRGWVSIPQWCDCCSLDTVAFAVVDIVSIPQWCDCCFPQTVISIITKPVSIPQWCDCC